MAMTIRDGAYEYVTTRLARREIVRGTADNFREILRLFGDFIGRDVKLSSVTRRDVERWLEAMECADATVRLRLSTVRGMFQWAAINGHCRTDPTLGIRGPKKPRTVPRGITDDEAIRVDDEAADARERLILILMLEEGLRACEVANLQVADVDLGAELMVVHGKGGHERTLPLTDQTRVAITDYLAERGRRSGSLIRSYQRSYANPGDGITAKYLAKMVSKAMKRAGVQETGHALRHTFAHGLIEAGASIRDVQGALGHASLMTTQVYLGFADAQELRSYMGKRNYALERESALGGVAS
jgi:site-specific recombinase XerD